MRLITQLFAALLLISSFAISVQAAEPPVATVNGKPIKQATVDIILKEMVARGQQTDDSTRAVVIDRLIGQEVVVQEAQKLGLDKQPDYTLRQELQAHDLLIGLYVQDYLKKNPIDEAALKAGYDQFKIQYGDKEYKTSNILLKTEQEAKDVIAQLAKGGDFAKIAKEKSLDTGSKDNGGSIDWTIPGRMMRPYADAMVKLQKGLYTTVPVQTPYGWHVIKLDDVRPATPPSYDTVKESLRTALQKQQLAKLFNDLRAKAKVVDNSAKPKK
jgi:peptidyl-prolyl cis-trans isomerase C